MTKAEKIKSVRAICSERFGGFPPTKMDDEEYLRTPWCHFGSLQYRGKNKEWVWDDTVVIDRLTTYRDVEDAYLEVTIIE